MRTLCPLNRLRNILRPNNQNLIQKGDQSMNRFQFAQQQQTLIGCNTKSRSLDHVHLHATREGGPCRSTPRTSRKCLCGQRVTDLTIKGALQTSKTFYGPLFTSSGWGARFTLVALTFLGQALSYSARVDMSVAIVAMVDRSELSNLHVSF